MPTYKIQYSNITTRSVNIAAPTKEAALVQAEWEGYKNHEGYDRHTRETIAVIDQWRPRVAGIPTPKVNPVIEVVLFASVSDDYTEGDSLVKLFIDRVDKTTVYKWEVLADTTPIHGDLFRAPDPDSRYKLADDTRKLLDQRIKKVHDNEQVIILDALQEKDADYCPVCNDVWVSKRGVNGWCCSTQCDKEMYT